MNDDNNKSYFYGKQLIDERDIEAVCSAFNSDIISQGPKLLEFEKRIAEYCGAEYCVAVSTGTAALHLACMALGIKQGNYGWTSALSFVASANCIRYCGGKVDFVDIDLNTFNIDLGDLEERFKRSFKENRLPKVIIPVHFAGQSCDMKSIREIANKYDCKVIEDACQALGGEYDNKKIGSCQYSDITVFSLHPVKSITTGEGGLVMTNNGELYEKIKRMRAHGIIRASENNSGHTKDPWLVEMCTEGYNYKITEPLCALGISQLNKLDDFISKRGKLVQRYREKLQDLPVALQTPIERTLSAYHILVIQIDFKKVKKAKLEIFYGLREKGINLSLHYYPIHLHSFYKKLGFREGMFPSAERYHKMAFTLPLHTGLNEEDIDYICDQLKACIY